MSSTIVLPEDVKLAHRFTLDGSAEIHTYLQPHNGVLKAHVRLVNIKKDGHVAYSARGVALSPEYVTELLQAVALLAVETSRTDV